MPGEGGFYISNWWEGGSLVKFGVKIERQSGSKIPQ